MQTRFQIPKPSMPRPGTKPMTFIGGPTGAWTIERITTVIGDGLPAAERLDLQAGLLAPTECVWAFHGVAGHARYVERQERTLLDAASPPLDRPDVHTGVFIPMCKSPHWWALTQEERRAIFEERSHHITQSLTYLPAIARGLYHSRDLGEPFDFLAWFEFAQEHIHAFHALLGALRASEEWQYVDREVEVWASR